MNAKTALYGLIGFPISHSLSPNIYNYLFAHYHRNAVYVCLNVKEQSLKNFTQLAKEGLINGFNITMPYKEKIYTLCDVIDPSARLVQNTNTVIVKDGKLHAYNTDGLGFLQASKLKKKSKISILGGGSVATTLASILQNSGHEVNLFVRNVSTTKCKHPSLSMHPWEDFENLKAVDLLINATPLGMENYDNFKKFDFLDHFAGKIFDLIYYPRKTKLIEEAQLRNIPTQNGLSLLVHQAVLAFELYTQQTCEEHVIENIIKSLH